MIGAIRIHNLYRALEQRAAALRSDSSSVQRSRAVVDKALQDGKVHYGINTGFGALVSQRISLENLQTLQERILVSHAVGFGPFIPKDISRLMILLKVHEFGLGYSGVSLDVFDRLLVFLEKDLIPAVPQKGSLGASGDLAPLAHLALPLIGEGEFWSTDGTTTAPAAKCLKKNKLQPVQLQPKDGLALCNGTQMMLAYGAATLHKASALMKHADVIAAMSLEAYLGSATPFHSKIQEVRPFPGQRAVAENFRKLLVESEILASHIDCERVQDPYSLRCIPQVHGATRDALSHVTSTLEIEIDSATDNPLIFDDEEILSGGNFHGQPLALTLDYAAIALSELASISERRIYLLTKGDHDLPKMAIEDAGLNSGVMVAHYTAAALVSENKILSHPASVDSIPTCLGQEDHVSMGSISATKLFEIYKNVERVLATELFVAAQALDFRKPLRPGCGVALAYAQVRNEVPFMKTDGLFGQNIDTCLKILQGGQILNQIEDEIGALH